MSWHILCYKYKFGFTSKLCIQFFHAMDGFLVVCRAEEKRPFGQAYFMKTAGSVLEYRSTRVSSLYFLCIGFIGSMWHIVWSFVSAIV